jgi:AcrR family transcriptional regulator
MPSRPQPTSPLSVRRGEIWRTAAEMINAQGYDATSVNDIARALGMTKAGLYHYISGKEALLYEIMSFGMDQTEIAVVTPARAIADPAVRLREIVMRHACLVMRTRGSMTQLVHEVRRLPQHARKKIDRRMRVYFDLIRDTLAELKTAGRLRDVDVTVATFSLLGMIMWLPRWYRRGGSLSADAVAADLADIALGGLLRPPRHRTRHNRGPQPRRLRLLKADNPR